VSRAIALAALVAVAACVTYVAGGPISTDDAWWHLALGETYASEGPWPARDPLLHTAHADAPVQHEWLFDVALHAWKRGLGLQGLRVLHVALVWGIVALVLSALRRETSCLAMAAAGACVFLALAWPRLVQLRPDLVSMIGVLLLYRWALGPRWGPDRAAMVASVVLLLVWANLHSLFAVGLVMIASAAAAAWLELGLIRLGERDADPARLSARRLRARRLSLLLCAGFAATLANPRGIAQHLTYFRSSADHAIWRIRDEWLAFDPFSFAHYRGEISRLQWLLTDALIAGFLIALGVAAWQLWRGRRRLSEVLEKLDPAKLAWALACVVALLVSIRFLWLGLFPLLVAQRARSALAQERGVSESASRFRAAALALVIAVALPFSPKFQAFAAGIPRQPEAYFRQQAFHRKYHGSGVAFLEQTGFEGKLFNAYSMGGYLGYWLAPRAQTFIDGRTEHYAAKVVDDYAAINQGGRGSERSHLELLDDYGIDAFFGVGLPVDGELYTSSLLEGEEGWILVQRKPAHAIYLRDLPRNQAALARIAAYYQAQGVPFDPAKGLDLGGVLRARPDWAAARKIVPPSYSALVRQSRSGSAAERAAALDILGELYAVLGLYDEQLESERALLALSPESQRAAERLAWGLLRLGRYAEASARSRAVLKRHPGSTRAINILRIAEAQPGAGHSDSARAQPRLTPLMSLRERSAFWRNHAK